MIIDFYRHKIPIGNGMFLRDIWAADDDYLENSHDYIQWLFPLVERSAYHPEAPTLSTLDVARFHANKEVRDALAISFGCMIGFYGFRLNPAYNVLVARPDFPERKKIWCTPDNHNFLRITRIIKSTRALGKPHLGLALFQVLYMLHGYEDAITDEVLEYWKEASA